MKQRCKYYIMLSISSGNILLLNTIVFFVNLPSIQVVYEYNTIFLLKERAASRTLKRPYSCTVPEKEQKVN